MVVQRDNWLARYVSSAEVLLSHHATTRVHGTAKRKQAFYDYFRTFSGDPVSPEFIRKLSNNAQKTVKGESTPLGRSFVSTPCPPVPLRPA